MFKFFWCCVCLLLFSVHFPRLIQAFWAILHQSFPPNRFSDFHRAHHPYAVTFSLFFSKPYLGWGLVVLGILLVFVSGKVVLLPTSLWYFFLSFVCLIAGFKMITTGRIDL